MFESAPEARWKAYLGVPVWLDRPEGQLPVGVVSLASMRGPVATNDHPAGHVSHEALDVLAGAMPLMIDTALEILTPGGDTEPRSAEP